jgi:EmrB/QacA subfamily drug resistance transporter
MGSVFLAALESTVVATAMPTVIASLGGIRTYAWVFSAFLLASTVTMPIWGRLADLLGRRRTYLAGLLLFLAGSALSGASRSMGELIAFRAVQGLGAGSLITIGMTIIGDLYGMERRAKMQGYFSSVWGVAALMGPLVGGVLADSLSWRWVFYINLPFGALACLAIAWGLRGEGPPPRRVSLDVAGTLAFAGAVTALLLALVEAGRGALWLTPSVGGLLLLAAGLLAAFVVVERRAAAPVVPLDLFANSLVRAAAVTGFLSGMAMFGALTYVPLFLQAVLGSTATQAGFVLTPFVLGWVTFSIVGARLALRLGYRAVVMAGMSALTLGFLLLAGWSESLTRLAAARDIVLAGAGMGLVFVPLLIAVQNGVPRAVLGSATALTAFFRTVGGAVGVGVMGSVMAHRLQGEIGVALAAAPEGIRPALRELAARPDLLVDPLARGTLGPDVLNHMRPVLAHAMGSVFVVGLVVAVLALASALLVPAGPARDLAAAGEPAASPRR